MKRQPKLMFSYLACIAGALMLSTVLAVGAETVFHGNVKTKVFHAPTCRYYSSKNCTAKFSSRDEAVKAGYTPCKICKP